MEILLKALLVPLVIGLASLASRRFGHGVAGVLAGFPIVAAPVTLMLVLELEPERIADIASATLASLPASIGFIVSFAWLSRRGPWWLCLAGATSAFAALGGLVAALEPLSLSSEVVRIPLRVLLPLAAPMIGLLLMPAPAATAPVAVRVPPGEILVRMGVGLTMGLALLLLAGQVSPAFSGLLLTWPVAGSVLPSFTAALHGHQATVLLLRGFAKGLTGFALFFLSLALLTRAGVPALGPLGVAGAMPVVVAALLHRIGRAPTLDAPPT